MSNNVEEPQEESLLRDDEDIDYLKPEVVYQECSNEEAASNNDKGLTQLGPFVEYIYDEGNGIPYNDHEYIEVNYTDATDDTNTPEIVIDENREDLIQPMMPFFLSSSHIFTTTEDSDDQNEGETIILQIDNEEEEQEDKQKAIPDEVRSSSLKGILCSTKTSSLTDTYPCEVCSESYGCLNCLKSHYETMHMGNTCIAQYKCKYSTNTSKGLCCPVCELTFDTRNETMDHYITHAVACDICGSGFDRQQYLTEHRRKVHSKGDFDVSYDCELCGTQYQYTTGLSKHYQKAHKLILCVECKLKFGTTKDLEEHEKGHKQKEDVLPYACSKCDKAFAEISEIAVHIRQDHNYKRKVEHFETVYVISEVNHQGKKSAKKKSVKVQK